MIDEDEISEVAFMDGFIEGYETAERELSGEVERLRGVLQAIHDHQKRMPNIDWNIWELTRAALGEKE